MLRIISLILCLSVACHSLNCTNERAGNCFCSQTHQNAKYELYCPSYIPSEQKINLKLEPGKFVTMTCSKAATIFDMMSNLEGLNIGNVKIVKFLNCPVPADSLSTLFVKMGMVILTEIEMLEFAQTQRSSGATEFQGYHFRNLSNLIVLKLPRNGMKNIDKTFFTEITKLKKLDLTNNRGIQIDGNSFQDLEELEELTCHSCYIQSFEPNTFKGLKNLKKISLRDNRLSSLPSGLFDHQKSLLSLNLAKNDLKELPLGIFDNMSNLTDIMLSYNKFKTFPENLFKMNKNLKTFTMLANGDCLPFMGCSPDRIQKLVLPENMFHEIEEIRMLWVPMKNIPKTFLKGCTNLVNLTIQNSFLDELPEELFGDTKKIKLIDFSGNNIETLPAGIFNQLNEVEALRFIKNKLTKLDKDQFVDLQNLKIVHFQENLLEDLPYELFSPTKKLKELDLSHNKLEIKSRKRFTGGSTFDDLKLFNLAHNRLSYIPEELTYNMLDVQVINMSYNNIGEDRNVIEPDDIKFMQRSNVVVDLSFNSIERIALLGDSLYENRNVEIISYNFQLNLTGNPLICDCIATELKQKMEGTYEGLFRNMFQLTSTDVRCGDKSSPQTSGWLLIDLPFADLTCPFPSPSIRVNCIDNCRCSLNRYTKETVIDCSNKNMTSLPTDLVIVDKHSDKIRLNMENNKIENICTAVEKYDGTSSNYKYISSLYLSNNSISSFNQECLPPDLKELFLDNNRIEGFNQADINYLENLVNRTNILLQLGNNRYKCDCQSRELYYFVNHRRDNIKDLDLVQLNCQDSGQLALWKAKFDEICLMTPPPPPFALIVTVILLVTICLVLILCTCYKEKIGGWIYAQSWTKIFFAKDGQKTLS